MTAQGVSAKCWIREDDGIYLYKVGRKELPASEILDVLGIQHVQYEKAEHLKDYLSKERIQKIEDAGEVIVRSKLLTNKKQGIIPFEEFAVYCANQDYEDEYKEAKKRDSKAYYENKLQKMYPLMDHDHAFDEEEILLSQTWEGRTLFEAAYEAQKKLKLSIDKLLQIQKPQYLTTTEWEQVRKRIKKLIK